MVENNLVELSEHETELYDRQIRLWGLDSQKRLRSARILLCGLSGFGAEIAKNIILSGIKSITFLDNRNLTDGDACSQFLAPRSELGKNRAVASLHRAQALNRMVEITVDTDCLDSKPDEFFANFDVVVVTETDTKTMVKVDNLCRMNGVKFFAGDVWGTFGYSFADLQEHNYVEDVMKHHIISKPGEKTKTELVATATKRTVLFPPMQDILGHDIKLMAAKLATKKGKRNGPWFLVLHVLQKFRDEEGRNPSYKQRDADYARLLQIRDQSVGDLVPDDAFVHVFEQISPVAAIVGGELAQEIIKAVSQKEAPHHNVFLFDPTICCGYVESIGN